MAINPGPQNAALARDRSPLRRMGTNRLAFPRKRMNRILQYLNHLVREPIDELTRAQRMLRFGVDLGRYGARQLTKDRAFEMAASLTYRTIFSLVPVVVLSMLVFRAFINEEQASRWVKEELNTVYKFLGFSTLVAEPGGFDESPADKEDADQGAASENSGDDSPANGEPTRPQSSDGTSPVAPSGAAPADETPENPPSARGPPEGAPSGDAASGGDEAENGADQVPAATTAEPLPLPESTKPEGIEGADPEDAKKLRVSLDEKIDELVERAWQTNLGNVGAAGIVLFIWGALALLIAVEDSFNVIFDCPGGRRWMSRITIYWAALTLGPVFILAGIYLANRIGDWGTHAEGAAWYLGLVVQLLSRFAALAASWMLLLIMYLLIPNTQVQFRPAVIGSLVGAILWEFAKWAFSLYVTTALPYSALYGSLALVPLFLYWLYVTWLIVLFGLELTAILQTMRGRTLEEQEKLRHSQRLMCDPQWFIPLMGHVAVAFRRGDVSTIDDLAQHLELPRLTVSNMTNRLDEVQLLHKVVGKPGAAMGYTLARPPAEITIQEILELGRRVSKHDLEKLQSQDWKLVRKLADTQMKAVEHTTLADLAAAVEKDRPDPQS